MTNMIPSILQNASMASQDYQLKTETNTRDKIMTNNIPNKYISYRDSCKMCITQLCTVISVEMLVKTQY